MSPAERRARLRTHAWAFRHPRCRGGTDVGADPDLSHLRALKGDERTDGIWSRALGSLGRLRPAVLGQPKLSYGAHVLTDKACRLADGSLGRVAVRESDGEVMEVCVPA